MVNTDHMVCRRYALRLTQRELAERIGITKDHVCRIENGHATPRLDTFAALCLALKTEPNKLMQWWTV